MDIASNTNRTEGFYNNFKSAYQNKTSLLRASQIVAKKSPDRVILPDKQPKGKSNPDRIM